MATTEEFRNGGATTYSSLQIEYRTDFPSDIKVRIDGGSPLTYVASSPSSGEYTVSGSTLTLGAAAGAGTKNVHIYRETNLETAAATFVAGSSVRAADLNACHDMVRLASQEQNQLVQTFDLNDEAITTTQIKAGTIVDADINASAAIAGTKVNPAFGSQNMSLTGNITVSGTVDGRDISTDGSKLDGIEAGATGNQDASEIRTLVGSANDSNVFTDTLLSKLNAIEASATQDQTASEIKTLYESNASTNEFSDTHKNFINDITATATEINLIDGVTATTDELNYVDGVTSNVQTQLDGKQPLDADLTNLAGCQTGASSALAALTQAEVQALDGLTATTTELNLLDGVTATTDELNLTDGLTATTTELNLLDGVTATTTELNLNDGQTATPTEVNILDGATVTTNEVNILDGVTASTAELNLLDGKSIVTSISGSATDVQIPSAQAVNERITTVVQDVGGFVPITNETSFPVNNPDLNNAAGTIVSIKALASAFTTGSGVTTHTISNGAGSGKNVTITGLTQSTTYPAGRGLILETTQYSGGGRGGVSTEYEYAFHRLTLDETGVADAQAAIDDFDERYYGPLSSNPATRPSGANRLNGDLYFNTSDGKMKVYNGSHASGTWDDVAAPGNFFINTISSSSGSGGGSATFNGTATRFTLSNPPLTAQQLLVSVNGVVQKPNSGTSPSEGFAISGSDIIFASAPASGAPYFIVTIGSSVNIGTPSDGTVTSAKIVDGSIVNADISSSAAIARTKLANVDLVDDSSPQLGGDLQSNGNDIDFAVDDNLYFGDPAGNHLRLKNSANGKSIIYHSHASAVLSIAADHLNLADYANEHSFITCDRDGAVELYYDNVKKLETDSLGVNVNGRLDVGGAGANDHLNVSTNTSRLRVGGYADLQIYHDSTNINYIENYNDIDLQIKSTFNGSSSKTQAKFIHDGAVELYHDNGKVFTTHGDGIIALGREGNSSSIHLHADEGDDNADKWTLRADPSSSNFKLRNYASGSWEESIVANGDGNVELYFNNSKKFETVAGGSKVTGELEVTSHINQPNVNSYIYGSGHNVIQTDATRTYFYGGTNGVQLRTADNSAALLYVDNSGKVGIGQPVASGVKLYVAGAGNQFIYLNNTTTGDSLYLKAGTGASSLQTGGGSHVMNFFTNGSERLRIQSGGGISFNGDTAAANALNDYEEGSWTPVVEGTTTTGTVTYVARVGKYVKIGKVVTWEMYIAFNNGDGSGTVHITGLPFTVANNGTYPAVNIGYVHNYSLRSNHHLYGLHASGGNYLYFYEMPDGGGSNVQPVYDGSGSLIMSGHYQVT